MLIICSRRWKSKSQGSGMRLIKPRSTSGMTFRKNKIVFEELLPIGFRVACRAHLLFHYSGVDTTVTRHDQLAEVQGSRQGEVRDRRRVDGPSVDGASLAVGLGQQREQIGLERPQPFVEIVNLTDLLLGSARGEFYLVLPGLDGRAGASCKFGPLSI